MWDGGIRELCLLCAGRGVVRDSLYLKITRLHNTKTGWIDTFATKRATNFISNPPSGYNLKHFHSTFSVTLPVLSSPRAIVHSPNL